MDFKAMLATFMANALVTFVHHVLYVRPAQLKIKQLTANENAVVTGVVTKADDSLIKTADSAIEAEATKLG